MSEQSCETRDLARGLSALLLWCPSVVRSHCWFELAKGSAVAVDSCIPGHGRGVHCQRCTMRQAALLRDGTSICSLHYTSRFPH
jgi:hypothetical protein